MLFHNHIRLFYILFCIYVIIQSSQRDVEDVAATGTASVGLDANLDEVERGGGLSPGKQTDSTDGVEFTSETGGEDKGADHSGHDPVNVEVCAKNYVLFYTFLCSLCSYILFILILLTDISIPF